MSAPPYSPGHMPMAGGETPYPPNTNQPGYPPNTNQLGYPPVMNQQPGYPPVQQQIPMQNVPPSAPAGGEQWMAVPQGISGVPEGLEYLSQIDQLLVKQKVEVFEMLTDIETANKYKIKNSMGQNVYKAKEKSNFCARQCCGPLRSFKMKITDNNDREVLSIKRPLNCSSCCFPCCLQEMSVTSPITGQLLGSIQQQWHCFLPVFSVLDDKGECVLTIEGPFCTFSFCGDVDFEIKDYQDNVVGKISKQWSGILKEAYTDADNFGVSFPMDLHVNIKAVLLAAVFLIDFMYFEQPADNE